jgi:DNA polymerase-3 subunit beta
MILTLSKAALLSALIFQAKKDVRYYLNGICFAPDKKLYSTDGHRAFIGEHDNAYLTENIIIAIKGAKVTSFEKAEIDTESGLVTYLNEHGSRVGAGICEVVDGRFPDIERVISTFKSTPTDEIGFNAGYLADIEKAAKLYNPKFCGIKIKPNGNTAASIVEFNSAFGNGKLVIMPMRL